MFKLDEVYSLIEKVERNFKNMPKKTRAYSIGGIPYEDIINILNQSVSYSINKDFTDLDKFLNLRNVFSEDEIHNLDTERAGIYAFFLTVLFESNGITDKAIYEKVNDITRLNQWSGYPFYTSGVRQMSNLHPAFANAFKDYCVSSAAFLDAFCNDNLQFRIRNYIINAIAMDYQSCISLNGLQRGVAFLKKAKERNPSINIGASLSYMNDLTKGVIQFAFDDEPRLDYQFLYSFHTAVSEHFRRETGEVKNWVGPGFIDVLLYELFNVPVEQRVFDEDGKSFIRVFNPFQEGKQERNSKLMAAVFHGTRLGVDNVEHCGMVKQKDQVDLLREELNKAMRTVLIRYFNVVNLKNFF